MKNVEKYNSFFFFVCLFVCLFDLLCFFLFTKTRFVIENNVASISFAFSKSIQYFHFDFCLHNPLPLHSLGLLVLQLSLPNSLITRAVFVCFLTCIHPVKLLFLALFEILKGDSFFFELLISYTIYNKTYQPI